MSSVKDTFYDEVDNLFNGVKTNSFAEQLPNPVAQQIPGFQGPVGWVENADSLYGGVPTVLINSDGITINNGRITLNDAFGQNVITGGGFGYGWLDFLDSGRVYNSSFIAGTLNNIAATTIVGTASTPADYAASVSADIPYWIIDILTAGNTLQRVIDPAAPSGYALEWTGASFNAEIFQDIPIVPGQVYSIYWTWKYLGNGNNFTATPSYDFRDVNHAIIGGNVAGGLAYTTDSTGYVTQWQQATSAAPANARYLRVYAAASRTTGTPDVRIGKIIVDPMVNYGPLLITAGDLQLDGTQGISWASGNVLTTNADTRLRRVSKGLLALDDGVGGLFGNLALGGQISGTPSATQNDWAPTGIHSSVWLRATPAGAVTLNGIDAGTIGELLIIYNDSLNNITINNENAGSSAANRFRTSGGVAFTLAGRKASLFMYTKGDGTNARWNHVSIG